MEFVDFFIEMLQERGIAYGQILFFTIELGIKARLRRVWPIRSPDNGGWPCWYSTQSAGAVETRHKRFTPAITTMMSEGGQDDPPENR